MQGGPWVMRGGGFEQFEDDRRGTAHRTRTQTQTTTAAACICRRLKKKIENLSFFKGQAPSTMCTLGGGSVPAHTALVPAHKSLQSEVVGPPKVHHRPQAPTTHTSSNGLSLPATPFTHVMFKI